ncbi:sensor histidine kinase [Desmospora activa]|uniref:histidine kinase n=1 Tax=Desmospora activa DSM 45169 TaxID=1121389 RepID=A0A2T4ZA16_9BACL|nr:sensor histidine kinase [Desmospora activa]PTM58720.1 signal transduction histidine kinase [Desmospora activa DSM 45169]
MKLFWRDHMLLLIIYGIQMALFPLVYWLDGYRGGSVLLYPMGLSAFFLFCYLLQRYIRHRSFYRRLSQEIVSLDESMQKTDNAPLSEALDRLMTKQFRLYQAEIAHYKNKLHDHITFITQWVHQMKTPISVIDLTIQEEDHPHNDSIKEELDRLYKGLDMVLYASRLEHFEHDFHVESIHLSQLVKQVISENRRLFIRHKLYPDVQIPDHLTIYSDEKWLSFILTQLLTNAVRYSAGIGKKITFYGEDRGKRVILEVRDEGVGIRKQDRRRVFDPYFTGRHGRDYPESTGMGLYLVREICSRLEHHVRLESKEGVGTVVRLVFRRSTPAHTNK